MAHPVAMKRLLGPALIAALLPLAVGAAAPAGADTTTDSAADTGTPTCSGFVSGFDGDEHAVERRVEDGRVTQVEQSRDRFGPWSVRSASVWSSRSVGTNSVEIVYAVLGSDDRPRWVRVTDPDTTTTTQPLRIDATRFRGELTDRLIAQAHGYYRYTLDRRGELVRRTTYQTSDGHLYYGGAHVLLDGLRGLTTLTAASLDRVVLDGRKTDLLWATTRDGALLQVQVPAHARARVVTVAPTGFEGVDGLSPMNCTASDETMFVAVDRQPGTARWYTITDWTHPSAANLVDHGDVVAERPWHLHAIN